MGKTPIISPNYLIIPAKQKSLLTMKGALLTQWRVPSLASQGKMVHHAKENNNLCKDLSVFYAF
jgi:hypothetical protein